jgi:hypothetical protein
MMKKMSLFVVAVVALALVVGCASTHVSQYSAPLEVKIQTDKAPVVEVGDKINGEATIQRVLFFKWGASKFADGVNYGGAAEGSGGLSLLGDTVAEGKAAAAYNARIANGADVIVVPRYEVTDTNYIVYQKTVFKVEGYKGVFKGLK